MDNDYVKKLTGKDRSDYEFAAAHIINNCDVVAFEALIDKSDFLFDFIKENVKNRLLNVITNYNYKNLLCFLKIYSYDYEDLIISTLVKFADEDLTDEMLEKLENGSESEKAYAAKYFSFVNDSLALEFLRKYAFSDSDELLINSAEALLAMKDEESFNLAIEKLNSQDDFEKLSAVKFLVAFKAEKALPKLFEAMKKSSMSEHIAAEIPYLKRFSELINSEYKNDVILALSYILNGLGEIVSLSQIFDFELYEIFNQLIEGQFKNPDSKIAVLLLNAREKFNQLTENDEYIFDEDKSVKGEVFEIKKFLSNQDDDFWEMQAVLLSNELDENSDFVFFAIELVQESFVGGMATIFNAKIKHLLNSQNQTLILKTVEVLKSLNKLSDINKDEILNKVSDANIKLIIESVFNQ